MAPRAQDRTFVTPRKTLATSKNNGRSADVGRFLRIDDVIATTGLSRATIYRLLAANDFPPKIALTIRCVGWWEAQVQAWLEDRLASHTVRP